MNILSFGEIVWDVYPDAAHIGGAPLNFAAHLARHGDRVWLASAVGRDEWGDRSLAALRDFGIHTDFVLRTAHPTGQCRVTLDAAGVPTFDLAPDAAYDRIDAARVTGDFDLLYFGTLALRGDPNRAALDALLSSRRFPQVMVDLNLRPPYYSTDTVRFALSHATWLKLSDEDVRLVAPLIGADADAADAPAIARDLTERFPNLSCVIVTLGARGAYARDRGGEAACGCEPVTVCSTVGAGDGFAAGFAHAYGHGATLQDSLTHATKVAARVVSAPEAVPAYDPNNV
ncbi:MAG: hypothetical protein IKI63_04080 [Clostridia bacterium]|nr:hypothetical protein [Clostridia bacterium]